MMLTTHPYLTPILEKEVGYRATFTLICAAVLIILSQYNFVKYAKFYSVS